MHIEGSVALITGAGSGLGRALAVELAARGATRLFLVGRRFEALEETRARLASPEAGTSLASDLTDSAQLERLIRLVKSFTPKLDLLVNNAGMVAAAPFETQGEDAWRRMLELNLIAPMRLTRRLLPLLRCSFQARVANVGSMLGDIGFPHFAVYSATKFGLRGWSEALRRELNADGIGVTYCGPRGLRTPAAEGFSAHAQAFRMPLDEPEDVARRIVTAIARNARDVYPSGPERLFLLIQRLLPGVVDRGVARDFARALPHLKE